MENEQNEQKKVLHWVRGNTLALAIPLEKETITEEETIKEDYIVEEDDVVTVNLVSSSRRYIYAPKSIEGNVVSIEDNGELDLGTYGVEVLISKANGKRLRSFWNYLIKIHNTNDVVLEEWDDFADVSGEILDSAIFFFAKGDPFTYEDFTQEQLNDIKRPALEAANVATQASQNANDAATNANNAKNATIIATTLANSATQNANDAASSANSAAISANQAKRNADTATINANNATESALQATNDAISATTNAERATEKTEGAIELAQRAAVIGSNPDFIGSDYYVYKYNARLGRYERSNIYVRGENGDKGEKGDKGDKGDAGTTDYNLLENKPTQVSQFDNDAEYATESFVNSSIATATATYLGSYNLVTDLGLSVGASAADVSAALATSISDADNNDYCFVQIPVATDTPTVIARIDRYKHNGSGWLYEYTLNNSGFTAEQWDAINSGITSGDVDKLDALPTNAQLTSLLNGKQDTINDLSTIRSGASAGATAYQKPETGIPESDLSQGVKDKMNEEEVFWATYGTTTAAEIDAAVAAGKIVLCSNSDYIYILAKENSNYYYLHTVVDGVNRYLQLKKSTNVWNGGSVALEKTSNKVTSFQATPDNTHYPSEKLVKDSLDAIDKLVEVEYGVTTYAEVKALWDDGKIPFVKYDGRTYQLSGKYSSLIRFGCIDNTNTGYNVVVSNQDVWTNLYRDLEISIFKKGAITGNESSNSYYPTTKAVADYVHQETAKWGVVSQTQTWTQASDGGYDYTMSNLQYGWIPQANIDLYESAGAVFNEQSGYFELNGLVDISYNEMKDIYNFGDIIKCSHVPASINQGAGMTYNNNIRTILAQQNYGMASWASANKINFGVNIYNTIESIHLPINMPTLKVRTIVWVYSVYEREKLSNQNGHDNILKIFTGVNLDGASGDIKFYADSLEKFEVYNLKLNLDLRMSSRLDSKSLAETINYSLTSATITITLHPTAYARAIADSDVQAALQAHTNVSLASAT